MATLEESFLEAITGSSYQLSVQKKQLEDAYKLMYTDCERAMSQQKVEDNNDANLLLLLEDV